MTLHRATTGFDLVAAKGMRPGGHRRTRRMPRPPVHVVDVEPGTESGTSLCGIAGLVVIDENWDRGMSRCAECRIAAERGDR